MARRISIQLIIAFVCLFQCSNGFAFEPGQLVRYGFDDNNIETGPDTFRIFEHSKGSVLLSNEFRYSGYSSVEIRDVEGDGDFPELQGYFPLQTHGDLYIHFALMITDPSEPFNIALAGPNWFRLKKDGIGFWLNNKKGSFYHVTDSIHKHLFDLRPFVWYLFDINYHIVEGKYDMKIMEEGIGEPVIDFKDLPNAANQANSKVSMFSFIGDLEDQSNAIYYIDDIEILTSEHHQPGDYVAPGRRKLFVDYWRELQQKLHKKIQCVPSTFYTDFGFSAGELVQMHKAGALERYKQLISSPVNTINQGLMEDLKSKPKLWAVGSWRLGCEALNYKETEKALGYFEASERMAPEAKIYNLEKAIAYAALGRFNDADNLIGSIYGTWYGDDRFAAAQALIGLTRNDSEHAIYLLLEEILSTIDDGEEDSLDQLLDRGPDAALISVLKKEYPNKWKQYLRERLLMEQYYFVLLWRESYADALEFTGNVIKRMEDKKLSAAKWHEFQGNAAFLMGDLDKASDEYERALEGIGDNQQRLHSIFLKLSDVAYLQGDLSQERAYRESVYGALK